MTAEDNKEQLASWELDEEMFQAEKQWREELNNSLPKSDAEWLQIFPEAKKVLKSKIAEWEEVSKVKRLQIKEALNMIEAKSAKENHWFWKAVLKHTFPPVKELVIANRNIKRLKWLTLSHSRKTSWNSALQKARERDIVSVVEMYGIKLKRAGKGLIASCPFHADKKPSFNVYPPSRFVCYGCQEKGDTIAFVQKMENCLFKEAVYKLQNL